MKKILLLGLMLLGMGGVISVHAGKYHATLSTDWYLNASWDPSTSTMQWKGIWATPSGNWGSYYFINTGLPKNDITSYTKFHATLSNFSDNVDHIWLRIKQGDDNYADAKLVAGENNIDLKALATANPDVDFTKVTDITLWGAREALDGKSINEDNPASVKIENVYLQTVKNITTANLNTEITSMSYLTEGNKFVIANTEGTQILSFPSGGPEATASSLIGITTDSYFYYVIEELPPLDVDNDGEPDEATYYRIAIQNAEGTAKPTNYWRGNYVNRIGWGALWSTSCQADGANLGEAAYGRDDDYNAVWTISYETGNGFVFYNPKNNNYMRIAGTGDKQYFKLYQSIDISINSEFDKEDNAADDQIFALSKATGYDASTRAITNGGWTFDTPVDISNWDYLMITTIDNASDGSRKIRIADDNGVSVTGNQYKGSDAGTGNDMYLDQWNHQNAIRISIDYLRVTKGLDISKIKSLTFSNNSGSGDCVLRISNVYLTDYNNTKISGGYKDGDEKREYSETGRYGTICLPYVASYAGCEVYNIASDESDGIALAPVSGLLEAGKPYFYKSSDEIGQNNQGNVRNVNFFRADLDTYDAEEPVENNGLIGTFGNPTATQYVPSGDNIYVVGRAANATEDKLYQVDVENYVTWGANRAYIDRSKINKVASSRTILLGYDGAEENESTAIESTEAVEVLNEGVFYDMSGREVKNPTTGVYIVKYGNVTKKVMIK